MLYFITSLTFCAGHRLSEFFVVVYTNVNTSLTEWECSDDIKDSIEERECVLVGLST